jgi:hypothetical protein
MTTMTALLKALPGTPAGPPPSTGTSLIELTDPPPHG